MKKSAISLPVIQLVGLTTRTNMKTEMDPAMGKIGPLVGRYFGENLAAQIPARKNPGRSIAIYTEYQSDEYGDYTYFIGEEVTSLDDIPQGFHTLTIPAANYQKFTTPQGLMPTVVIDAWQEIWKMTPADFGGKRAYVADFEVYDARATDPGKTSLDIYIGIV